MTSNEDDGRPERTRRHRLGPGQALRDLDDAAAFVEEMGLVLQTPHPYLPSLFGAVQGKPAKAGVGGFGDWPEHAWSWAGELAEREDMLLTKTVLGRRTLVHRRLWAALDAAVRGRAVQGGGKDDEQRILGVLAKVERLRTDVLRDRAGFPAGSTGTKVFQKAMGRLESLGLVLSRPVLVDQHKHVAIAELWERRFLAPLSKERGVEPWVMAALVAAGGAPENDVLKWFAWPRKETLDALVRLESEGKIGRDGGVLRVFPS